MFMLLIKQENQLKIVKKEKKRKENNLVSKYTLHLCATNFIEKDKNIVKCNNAPTLYNIN